MSCPAVNEQARSVIRTAAEIRAPAPAHAAKRRRLQHGDSASQGSPQQKTKRTIIYTGFSTPTEFSKQLPNDAQPVPSMTHLSGTLHNLTSFSGPFSTRLGQLSECPYTPVSLEQHSEVSVSPLASPVQTSKSPASPSRHGSYAQWLCDTWISSANTFSQNHTQEFLRV